MHNVTDKITEAILIATLYSMKVVTLLNITISIPVVYKPKRNLCMLFIIPIYHSIFISKLHFLHLQ